MSESYRERPSSARDDRGLVPVLGLLWILCAANVVSGVLQPSFGVRNTLCLAMLFLLPLVLRKTLSDLLRARHTG